MRVMSVLGRQEEVGCGERARGCVELVALLVKSRRATAKEELPCINESKPPIACALTRAVLLCLGCLSEFIPVSQACM